MMGRQYLTIVWRVSYISAYIFCICIYIIKPISWWWIYFQPLDYKHLTQQLFSKSLWYECWHWFGYWCLTRTKLPGLEYYLFPAFHFYIALISNTTSIFHKKKKKKYRYDISSNNEFFFFFKDAYEIIL